MRSFELLFVLLLVLLLLISFMGCGEENRKSIECFSNLECESRGMICKENQCVGCQSNLECESRGMTCKENQCAGCQSNDDCVSLGYTCVKNRCVGCSLDKDCGGYKICRSKRCVEGCLSDINCAKGYICQAKHCVKGCVGYDCIGNCVKGHCFRDCKSDRDCDKHLCDGSRCFKRCKEDSDCKKKGELCNKNTGECSASHEKPYCCASGNAVCVEFSQSKRSSPLKRWVEWDCDEHSRCQSGKCVCESGKMICRDNNVWQCKNNVWSVIKQCYGQNGRDECDNSRAAKGKAYCLYDHCHRYGLTKKAGPYCSGLQMMICVRKPDGYENVEHKGCSGEGVSRCVEVLDGITRELYAFCEDDFDFGKTCEKRSCGQMIHHIDRYTTCSRWKCLKNGEKCKQSLDCISGTCKDKKCRPCQKGDDCNRQETCQSGVCRVPKN